VILIGVLSLVEIEAEYTAFPAVAVLVAASEETIGDSIVKVKNEKARNEQNTPILIYRDLLLNMPSLKHECLCVEIFIFIYDLFMIRPLYISMIDMSSGVCKNVYDII
jgi:hypothetical protein